MEEAGWLAGLKGHDACVLGQHPATLPEWYQIELTKLRLYPDVACDFARITEARSLYKLSLDIFIDFRSPRVCCFKHSGCGKEPVAASSL